MKTFAQFRKLTEASVTYTKLKTGDWGLRIQGSVKPGDAVTVSKKNGDVKRETVGKVVWTGNGISLATIGLSNQKSSSSRSGSSWDSDKFNGYGRSRGGWHKSCVTDGNCSSIGSGKSCGGYDCDGY